MKKNTKKLLAAFLAALMVFSITGCGNGDNEQTETTTAQVQETEEEKTIVMAITNPWETFNPFGSSATYNDIVSDQIYDRLMVINFDGTTSPRLAKSYEVAEDKTSITFYLDENARWHDGEPVDADDVIFSAHLDATPDFISTKRNQCKYFAGTDDGGAELTPGSLGVEKLDQYTVRFTFKTPMNELPILCMFNRCFYVLPEHIYGNVSVDELNTAEAWQKQTIGSGPWIFDSQTSGERIEFVANENYHLGAPDFDRLIIRVVQSSQLLAGMMTGEIDMVAAGGLGAIPLSDWDAAQELEGFTAVSSKTYAYQAMVFNTQSEKMPSKEIRQAINMAINRQVIVDTLIEGEASILYSPLPDYHPYHNPDVVPEYDPVKAKQMLIDAGYDFDQTLELIVPVGNEIRIQSTVLIQQDLAAIGVDVNITQYDFATLMQMMRDGEFDLSMCGASGSLEPSEPFGWLSHQSTNNFACLQDTKFHDLYTDAINELDYDLQKEKHYSIQEEIINEAPIAYLYSQNTLMAYNSERISNVDVDSFGNQNWCTWEWEVK